MSIAKEKLIKMKCSSCSKEYGLKMTYYASNLEERRLFPYNCPYCHNKEGDIKLRGNEDVEILKLS